MPTRCQVGGRKGEVRWAITPRGRPTGLARCGAA